MENEYHFAQVNAPQAKLKVKYTTLKAKDACRVLVLLPGTIETNISCLLQHHKTDSSSSYEALSYTWGEESPTRSISLNGKLIFIRQNLWDALHSLRLTDRPRPLFIDALCINQADLAERGIMVAKMSSIYRSAQKVLVWVGKSTPVIDRFFRQIQRPVFLEPDLSKIGLARSNLEYISESYAFLDGMCELFDRPYWTRVWIIQEILSAMDLELCCGKERIPWIRITNAWNLLFTSFPEGKEREALTEQAHKSPAAVIIEQRYRYNGAKSTSSWNSHLLGHPLHQLLSLTKSCRSQCFDIRDRIYGLTSIASVSGRKLQLKPDYTKTPAQLCMDVFLESFGGRFRTSDQKTWYPPPPADTASSNYTIQLLLQEPLWDTYSRHLSSCLSLFRPAQMELAEKLYARVELEHVAEISTAHVMDHRLSWRETLCLPIDMMPRGIERKRYLSRIYRKFYPPLSRKAHHVTQAIDMYLHRDYLGFGSFTDLTSITERHSGSAETGLSRPSTSDSRLFLATNNFLGLGPPNIQAGDVLCKVEPVKDLYVVIRPLDSKENEERIMLLGRAIMIETLQSDEHDLDDNDAIPDLVKAEVDAGPKV